MRFTLFSASGGRRYLVSAAVRRNAGIGFLVVIFLAFLSSPQGIFADLLLGPILLWLLWDRFKNRKNERLYSYGTLQQPKVQLANFGRHLRGNPDTLTGWRLSTVLITDPVVLAESGLFIHKILVPGDPSDEIQGMVFELTPEELKAADSYETDSYKRIKVTLRSGIEAWVYVSAQTAHSGPRFVWLNKQGVRSATGAVRGSGPFEVQFTGRFTCEYREDKRVVELEIDHGVRAGKTVILVRENAFEHWDNDATPNTAEEQKLLWRNFEEALAVQDLLLN
jgi:hypothetical protein